MRPIDADGLSVVISLIFRAALNMETDTELLKSMYETVQAAINSRPTLNEKIEQEDDDE